MQETLKLLSSIICPEHESYSFDKIAQEYQQTKNPSLLGVSFSRLYNLIHLISKRYYGLTTSDVASFSVEVLDRALLDFNEGTATFPTFYANYLKNRLRMETEALFVNKRRVNIFAVSYDQLIESGIDYPVRDSEMSELAYLQGLQEDYNLGLKDFNYCNLLLSGYTNREIAEKLGVSIMALSHRRKNIRKMLRPVGL